MVIGKRVLRQSTSRRPSRHPLKPIFVFVLPVRTLCHLDVILLRLCVRIDLEEITMYVPQVHELDVGRVRAKVESCDFDGADEGRSLGVGELSVEDVDQRLCEGRVEFVPFQVDRHFSMY